MDMQKVAIKAKNKPIGLTFRLVTPSKEIMAMPKIATTKPNRKALVILPCFKTVTVKMPMMIGEIDRMTETKDAGAML